MLLLAPITTKVKPPITNNNSVVENSTVTVVSKVFLSGGGEAGKKNAIQNKFFDEI